VKRFLIVVMAGLFVAGFCATGFAAKAKEKSAEKKYERIVASVVSIDAAARTMVVTREENGESRTITISAKAAAQVQVGDRVRIKLKAGTNESAGVRVLGAKPVPEDAAAEQGASIDVKADAKADLKAVQK
jgi:hypothetical protein